MRSVALVILLAACSPHAHGPNPQGGDAGGLGSDAAVPGDAGPDAYVGPTLIGSLQALDGEYVTAENGGGGVVNANRAIVGPWETFHVELLGPAWVDGVQVHFRSDDGHYLRAINHGGAALSADSDKAGTWETFTIHRLAGAGPIDDADTIAIETDNGHYVVADGDGGGLVEATSASVGPAETFAFNAERLPPALSRDAIVNVHADFANLRDGKDRPMFTPFLFSLIDDCDHGDAGACADVEDWIGRLQAEGDTHIAVSTTYNYAENLGWAPDYPIHPLDLTGRVPTLRKFLEKLIRRGFTPVLFLGCDGHASDPNGGYNDPVGWSYGLPWCTQHLPDLIGELRAGNDLAPYILWIGGWDGCFPDWSPDQTNQFHTLLRSLVGPDANIATEFGNGYIHMGNGGADWYAPGLDQVDVFFLELPTNVLDPSVQCGVQQVAARMLGPAIAFAPGPPCDGTSPPYYLSAPRARSLTVVAWEYAAYLATRKDIDVATARQQGQYLESLGFHKLGNGR